MENFIKNDQMHLSNFINFIIFVKASFYKYFLLFKINIES